MDGHLKEIINRVENLRKKDISYKKLGPEDDFQQVEDVKNSIADYICHIINEIDKFKGYRSKILFEQYIALINSTVNQMTKLQDRIAHLKKHDQQFPQNRGGIINDIFKFERSIKEELYSLENDIRISSLEGTIGKSNFFKKLENDANASVINISQKEKESSKILGNLQAKVMAKGIAEGAASFSRQRSHHSKTENGWFISFIFFSFLTAGAIGYVVYWKFDIQDNTHTVFLIFQRILILSGPSIFLKISLSKYHIERNLRIIYDHKATVLEQYKTFENAIGDDAEAKNKLRLEIAKYIFSDPQTGYISKSKSNDVSVSPIINMPPSHISP